MKRISFLFLLFLMATAFLPLNDKTTVYLVGDSTISIKETRAYPETGWGMPFTYFFDSTIQVDNRAKNGRSTRTFIEEGLWAPVVGNLKKGDYVLVQFGHNDEVQTKKSATTEAQFTANLVRYVSETGAKGAFPVLITPAARRKFTADGRIEGTHDKYAALVRDVAATHNVPLIDLDVKSQALIQSFGVEGSKMLFLHLQPGEHPAYPEGKVDDTHFSELGARKMAQIVLAEIKNLQLPLAAHIYQPPAKK